MRSASVSGLILCFVFGICQAQDLTGDLLTRDSLFSVSLAIMKNAGNCVLISQDDTGRARARTMDPFPPEENMEVWLGTNSKSRKVDQIRVDPRVSLYYFDKENSGYVIIYGTANLINDPQMKKDKWKEAWEAFYPDRDQNYLLIQVIPETLEILSPNHGVFNDPVTWRPQVIHFN